MGLEITNLSVVLTSAGVMEAESFVCHFPGSAAPPCFLTCFYIGLGTRKNY